MCECARYDDGSMHLCTVCADMLRELEPILREASKVCNQLFSWDDPFSWRTRHIEDINNLINECREKLEAIG